MMRFACLLLLVISGMARAATTAQTQANVMVELSFTAARAYADPFKDVALDVTFTDPGGRAVRVPAFWAGKNVWKVRYASPVVGTHAYHTEIADAAETGLHNISGTIEVAAYTGTNPLYVHGPARVAANKRYLEYGDGTPFFWLGDTWWMGLCHRLHWPDEVKTLAADRKAKGFTVIQLVAGLYPDMMPFDPRGANEAGFPWEKDYTSIRPEYFDAADKRLLYLVDQGFTPCIVGAWGYFMPWMGVEKMEAHWRYLIARYGALPVFWCAAGEANLPWYQVKDFPYDDRAQVTQWTQVMRYIRETDPYHRPLTIHPTGLGRLSSRHATDDVSALDFDFLQTPHGQRDAVAPTIATVRESYADTPRMPVINGEASYEMLGGIIKTEWTRRMFWLCMTNGAAGHTYGANGIWQCNRQGQPHGPSPTAGSPPTGYGTTPWDEAMNFAGSAQVGMGKKFFEQFAWQNFEPHAEWASYVVAPHLTLDGSDWIWFPEGNPGQDAPAAKRYFRRSFTLPGGIAIKDAHLIISADDRFSVALNGAAIGTSSQGEESWRTVKQFDIAKQLQANENILAIEAENLPAAAANPAGLIARVEVRFQNGESFTLGSDAQWQASKDEKSWLGAAVAAHYGQAPWGRIDPANQDPIFGPQSTGISGDVRVIYVPDPQPVELHALTRGTTYNASCFDPVTGQTSALPAVLADDNTSFLCPPPADIHHDWVLVLREKLRK